MVFAKLCAEVVQEARDKGIDKPVVASLVGDVQVEEASEYLYERGIVAYPYTTELPVAVLGREVQMGAWGGGDVVYRLSLLSRSNRSSCLNRVAPLPSSAK